MATVHQIHVGRGGTFDPSGDFATSPEDIDALFEHFRANSVRSITLHFHGGLVNEAKGVEIAKMMRPVYEAADTYPVSFVWETGLLETLRQNLTRVHETKLFEKILKWVIKRAAQRFGGFEGKGAGVPISDGEIEAELQKERPFDDYDDRDTGKGASRGGPIAITEDDLDIVREELEAEFAEDVDDDEEVEALLADKEAEGHVDASQKGIFTAVKLIKALTKITFRVIRRHVRDRDHGFYPTVVEEILREYYLADLGAFVWGSMKDKAAAMWADNDEVTGEDQHVGSYFLAHLDALRQEKDIRINLVGHSAGSTAICHMLAASERYPNVSYGDIAFLAPAVRSDVAVSQVARQPGRFESFRQFTMSDGYERDDQLVKGVYTRSLLYFISGVLEPDMVDKPIAGMMRYASREAPFDEGLAREWADFILADGRLALANSTVLAPDAPEGMRTASETHGGFDNDALTQQSLTAILKA